MAKVIKNSRQLEKAMGELMKDAIFDASKAAEEIVDEFLRKWYGDYYPSQYDRTNQFLYSCVTSKVIRKGDTYSTTIYIDWKHMHHTKYVQKGDKMVEKKLTKAEERMIVEYANEGIHGIPGENQMVGKEPIRFWDDALAEMEQKDVIINAFYDWLKAQGYNVKFKQSGMYEF